MALTPEDVVNKRFTITKFRDGYDLDQVDDFLDEVVAEFKRYEDEIKALTEEKQKLAEQLEEAKAGVPAQSTAIAEKAATEESAPATGAVSTSDAIKSSNMLQLASELHDKYIHEGETKRDQLISEAEQTAHDLVSTAQKQRSKELSELDKERKKVEKNIASLREFEGEYRNTLRSYIQGQIRELENSPEPDNYPVLD